MEDRAISTQDKSTEVEAGLIRPTAFSPASGVAEKQAFKLKPAKVAIGAALFVSALLVLFLFTAKAVVLHTTPKSNLSVSGGLSFKLAEHYLLLEGDYSLQATAKGYEPLEEVISIGSEQNQTLSFELKKLPGHLIINTDGVDGNIWIDEQLSGKTEQEIRDISAGEHTLRIDAARYQIHEQTVDIIGLDQQQSLDISLRPAWANISFSSTPEQAELYADGVLMGQTPLTVELMEGEHQLMLKLAGHKAWQESLDIEAQKDFSMPEVRLEKADGLVMVKTQPSGAGITVNGTYRGLSPFEFSLAPGQSYQLSVFKDGYRPANKTVSVTSGKEQTVNIKLDAQLGDIRIVGRPEDALLYVDGRLMGRAKQTLSLPAKQHQITVKKEGYVDFTTVVLPRPGIAQAVSAKLLTLEEAKWKNIKPVITTAADSKLKLFKVDAKFKMGASRREQGRRSNEAMRSIQLNRAFYLGITEVTNAQYRKFVKFHSSGHAKGNSLNGEHYPVVNISWEEAARYCNWLSEQEDLPAFYLLENDTVVGFSPQSTGYRLPSEAEWAWAARYQNDGKMLKFPWGPSLPPAEKSGNYGDRRAAALLGNIQVNYDDGHAVTAPVASFPNNSKGLYDIGGNVAEWMGDFYGIKTGLSRATERDPLGPSQGSHHVIRGSSWAHGSVTDLRMAFRDYGTEKRYDLGFRVARYAD